jgi:hypothetical protein
VNHFLPSAANGLRGRQAMQARLAESLAHIFEQCAPHIDFDEQAAAALVDRMASGARIEPALFGSYFILVAAIEKGEMGEIEQALRSLLDRARRPLSPPLRIRPLNRSEFSEQEERELRRSFVSESLLDEQIEHLTGEEEAQSRAQFARALSILAEHAPATYAELEVQIGELIPARGRPARGMEFDGCSSLERWGSILINAGMKKTDLELAETIAHEAGHNALFALAPVDGHVENDDSERYSSPLRVDPRPMNGIYHATFVLARMCFAMRQVAASPTAPASLAEEARERAAADVRLFMEGYEVVRKHARFTPEGRRIMLDAAEYMAAEDLV